MREGTFSNSLTLPLDKPSPCWYPPEYLDWLAVKPCPRMVAVPSA